MNKKNNNHISVLRLFFTGLFLVILAISSYGQSVADIQNIKVDELSDAQLEQLIKRAESSGMTEQQLEAMARERGMPATEVAKLRQRINKLRRTGKDTQSNTSTSKEVEGREWIQSEEEFAEEEIEFTEEEEKIFGFKLFRNKNLNFTPNLNIPTPQNYILGAGDQLLIDIYGASQFEYDLNINSDGLVFIPNVGPVNLSGLTVEAATSRLSRSLGSIYSGLGGSSPNTFMKLRVGNIRSIQVSLVGEVFSPGSYTLSSFASVFNALYAAGGIKPDGSFRNIRVYRNSKMIAELDIYDFLVNGNQSSNVRLEYNDVILIPPVEKRVEITGPVRREGFFEMKNDENLKDLIKFSGGFSSKAYSNSGTVFRTTDNEFKVENIESQNFENFVPKDGDKFIFGELLDRFENRVQVSGALLRSGTYALEEGMGVKDLIQKAGGLRADAFMNRAALYRTREDFSLEMVTVNISEIVMGNEEDISLKREDVLYIPSIYDLREEFYVIIGGEINRPGSYAFAEQMSVSDLVFRAGGLKESATSSQIEIARRVKDDVSGKLAEIIHIDIDKDLKILGEDKNFVLMPFDNVIVRRSSGFQRSRFVSVEGEVLFPGEFAIAHANERISDLLRRAGGLNQFAYPKGATLIRRNEFFEGPSEEEIKSTNLTEVKRNLQRIKRDTTEAEKILLNRIDQKIEEKGGGISNKSGGLLIDDFKKETIEDLVSDNDSLPQEVVKTQDMIGIDLVSIINNPGSPFDLIIQEGDVLSIPKLLQTVRMRGEVLFPTTARYEESNGFKSYISRAGGFTDKSRKKRSYVVYANGDVRRTSGFLFFKVYPKIEPGSEIIIPSKKDKEPLSIQGWLAITTTLTTLVLVINQLNQ
ncbi:SLBB domain-containing protein [Cognataquiflexum rubidum]|uniref:SLBB domain-containing protein n=1 Tax=Cognataquiflexum rubidum TaxID=2922273 RepID=UPI001F131533|nr:SLBB domain-containing protein [Cognataquiflexum rubidum]MCH6234314.1 SLBB domain-containing protein [Cognataquiflexum rubidum]